MFVINQHNIDPSGIPRDGLFGEWLFSGNAQDTSGEGNDMTVNGPVLAVDRKSVADSCYEFDGSNDYMQDPTFNPKDFVSNQMSISFWVKFDVTSTDRTLIILSSNTYTALLIQKQNTGRLRLLCANAFHTYDKNDIDIGINTTNWFHFVINYQVDNSNLFSIELFKNGVSILNQTQARTKDYLFESTSKLLTVGSLWNTTQRFHDGKLDDIRMYDRILTTDEITALYNE